MIGVVCAHVAQVSAVKERLGSGLSEVYVETADRFQGLERAVMLVHHPLSGRVDADEFHTDAGRLCVMLSRHRIACLVFGRAGMSGMLERQVLGGDRILGAVDKGYMGWKAHRTLLDALEREGRLVSLVKP
jgi:superfamily I DNA and/or RNA helicase